MAEWKDIPLWDGYVVSNEGEVARKDTGQILKTYQQKSGYVYVWLSRGSGRQAVPLHQVVAMAFHGTEGYEQGLFVDHIDTNRANNRADNLHWVTPKGNANNPHTLIKRRKNKKIKKE